MSRYKKIALAVDFYADNKDVIETARQVRGDSDAQLLLVHVCEPITAFYAVDGVAAWGGQMANLESSMRVEAKKHLLAVAAQLEVNEDSCHLLHGVVADEIHQLVEQQNVDLVVLGSHGKHGLKLLLGSTASSVLHGASCDVLAVRISEDS